MTGRDDAGAGVALLTVGAILLVGVAVAGGAALLSGDTAGEPPDSSPPTTGPERPDGPGFAPGDRGVADAYERLHEENVTGDGVRVGIVDVTGYDPTDPRIRDQVRGARAFGTEATIRNGGRNGHGTAAARIVSRVAPDADLYLANFGSPGDFQRAVSWLLERDVDVIVAPVSFYGQPDDGTAPVSRAASRARDRGVVFVAPVGNLARGHWEGRYDDVENGTLRFGTDGRGRATRNYVRGEGSELTLWLSWAGDRDGGGANYSVVLYQWNGSTVERVARSEPYPDDAAANERIATEVDEGQYFVVVEGPDEPTGDRLELTSPTHRLGRSTSRGSIAAPATARGVVGVGAYDRASGGVAPFSSRGPTADGRPGVDLVAPGQFSPNNDTRLVGSSAAAPHVAGVAALILGERPTTSPGRVEAALELTAVDVGAPGYDMAAGHGIVAPVRAVGFVTGEPPVDDRDGVVATDGQRGTGSSGGERSDGSSADPDSTPAVGRTGRAPTIPMPAVG